MNIHPAQSMLHAVNVIQSMVKTKGMKNLSCMYSQHCILIRFNTN